METSYIEGKKFRKRLIGFDPNDVEAFIQEMSEELRRLSEENENLRRDLQTQESELKEHRERDKTIRAVLFSAQKSAEQIRANAEREGKLIISEAELKAEGLLHEAGGRLIKIEQEMSEMRRNRIRFGARVRSLLDAFRQILDDDGMETPRKFEENPDSAGRNRLDRGLHYIRLSILELLTLYRLEAAKWLSKKSFLKSSGAPNAKGRYIRTGMKRGSFASSANLCTKFGKIFRSC